MPEERIQTEWKEKYLCTVAEFESREKKWAETEALLRQALIRLALAAEGIDPVLDRNLDELRGLLRAGADPTRLRAPLEQISESVRNLDNRQPGASERTGMGQGLLGRLFRRGAGVAAGAADAERRRLRTARNLLQELVEDLLGSDAGADLLLSIERADSEVQVYNLGHELAMRLQSSVRGAHRDLPRDGLKPHEVLLRLLEQIEVPSEQGGHYEDIRQLLLGSGARDHTEEALAAIADLVADIRGRAHRDRSEIESFLSQVAERLAEIDTVFQESLASRREGLEERQIFDRKVDDQVREIEASVGQSKDLEMLKGALRQRIDVIRAHMRQYRESGAQRLSEAERRAERLNERLQSVQHESDELRRRLKEEHDLAMVDPLTGIANRLAYDERLELEVGRWKRYRSPLTLAICDIDRFKGVNDRFGHQAGDKALILIAKLIRRHIRETDFVARYGGEEFALLLPETRLSEGIAAAEHVRREVMDCGFHYQSEPVPITISCGVSEFHDGDTAQEVFGRADAALYRAKAQGRNCCVTG